MSTPSAPQPDPRSWVRGPRSAQSTQPARPAADGGTAAPVGPPAPAGYQAPVGQTAYSPHQGFGGGLPSAPVRQGAPAPRAQPVVEPAPRPVAPVAPRPAAPAVRQTTGPGTMAPAPRQAAPRSNAPARTVTSGRPTRPRTAGRGRPREDVGWVKAHGGSGATSLVEALGGVDMGARWPEPARGEPYRVVLVGRTSASGLRSVSQALGALRDGTAPQGLELLAVVLVADAPGRLPLSLLRRIRVLRSVARVHRVPWIPAWRTDGRLKHIPGQLVTLSRLVGSDVYGEGALS
ncbi:hypothetical protein OG226_19175 [Streptomyces sp. NBC_01261]|uniref:hypothetical protein n=1 Tax=Streptomyces sp. NBC_01261 TaxID=2903802 RepID=UPI002E33526D|nr:hypothetical protein [Streptomyces sp. NBC_01261]